MKSNKILVVASVLKYKVTAKRNTLTWVVFPLNMIQWVGLHIAFQSEIVKHPDTCDLKKPRVKIVPLPVEKSH